MDDDRLAFTPLMDDEVCIAAWPGHPLAGRRVPAKSLAETSMVLREPGSGTRMFLVSALKKAGLNLTDFDVAAEMGSTMAVLQAVRAQVGVGFVSRRAMVDDLDAGHLVALSVKGLEMKRQFYLTTRKGRTHSPAAQAFMTLWLAEVGALGKRG